MAPTHIWNYDETNLSDNPGASKAIFRKGTKYPEQVRDHTKTAVSLMFCCSAAGKMLPPYVVYKALNFYPAWAEGGPEGAIYTATKSGWFDHFCFEDWYFQVFLPAVRKLQGKKVLVGDNLSSHISSRVIESCREHDIEFVCLPPHSTDRMQPLDVGLFAPMKRTWRAMLQEGRARDPDYNPIQKTAFAKNLKQLISKLNHESIMPNAFAKCGLHPVDKNRVLAGLPSALSSQAIAKHLDASLLKKLEVRRFGEKKNKNQKKGKKVPAGASYTAAASVDSSSDQENEASAEQSEVEELPEVEELSEVEELPELSSRAAASSSAAASSRAAANSSAAASHKPPAIRKESVIQMLYNLNLF